MVAAMAHWRAATVGAVAVAFGTAAVPAAWGGGPPPGGGEGHGQAPAPTLSAVHLESKTLQPGHGQLDVSYFESAAGKTTATIEKPVIGVKVNGHCLPPQDVQGIPVAPPCRRWVKVSSAVHSDRAGLNSFKIPEHLTKGLKKGSYELSLVARAGGKVSRTTTLSFKVL